jgi:endogenous inhibitor of DNA gyrase (YacG/DUF329 family)
LTSSNRREEPRAGSTKCPVCKAPARADYLPFCSKRCADIDLHRWLSGGYAIPAVEQEGETDEEPDGGRS